MFTDEPPAEIGGASRRVDEIPASVQGLVKRYGHRVALDNLKLVVRAGEVCGLVGANGSGKTTTLRILAGLLKPDQGRGQVLGFDLLKEASRIRQHIGYLSQRFSLYADLSVFENLRFRAQVYGLHRPQAVAEAAIKDFELTDYAGTAVGLLSGGWARRLQMAAALIHAPRLVLLDEPTAGLDALSRQKVWRRIARVAADGAGVIVSTHDLADAERCSVVTLLSEGRFVAAGPPERIARSAPATAFLLSGTNALRLARLAEAIPGVIASYPQGPSLRVLAQPSAATRLHLLASINKADFASVAMRLEDAVLTISR